MVKLTTRLSNDTNKQLVLCEEASNGSQTRIKVLDPRVPDKQISEGDKQTSEGDKQTSEGDTQTSEGDKQNAVLVTNRDTGKTEIAGYSPSFYVHSVDPNDSYATLRLWFGNKAVLGVSSDEMIDNMTITIEEKEGVFRKRCEPRNPQNQPAPTSEDAASTSEGDAPSKKKDQSTSSPWGNFINVFRPRKSANTNAGK